MAGVSLAMRLTTDTEECDPDETSCEWVIIDFRRNY
jgi:hypothetical protein